MWQTRKTLPVVTQTAERLREESHFSVHKPQVPFLQASDLNVMCIHSRTFECLLPSKCRQCETNGTSPGFQLVTGPPVPASRTPPLEDVIRAVSVARGREPQLLRGPERLQALLAEL